MLIVLAAGVVLVGGGCGDNNVLGGAGRVAHEKAFRVVASEEVGLSGAENAERAAISFLLVGSAEGVTGETELVEVYAAKLEAEGWDLVPHEVDGDWWTLRGTDGEGSVRVGPASRFVERATIEEGFSRTRFRGLVAEDPGPLIVVSVDPGG